MAPIAQLNVLSQTEVKAGLLSKDKKHLINVLSYLGEAGETPAVTMGYGAGVAPLLGNPDPEVVAAAAKTLGGMGVEGARYAKYLVTCFQSPDSVVRSSAAEAMGTLGTLARPFAADVVGLLQDSEILVKIAALRALGGIGDEYTAGEVEELVNDDCPEVAAAATVSCAALGISSEEDLLKKLSSPRTRYAALLALLQMTTDAPEGCAEGVVACIADKDVVTRQLATQCIGVMGDIILDQDLVETKLKPMLKDEEVGVRAAAAMAFAALGSKVSSFADAVAELLNDGAEDCSGAALEMGVGLRRMPVVMKIPRCAAMSALAEMHDTKYLSKFADFLTDNNWEVRRTAVEALGTLGEDAREQTDAFTTVLDDDSFYVRARACEALGMMKAAEFLTHIVDKFEDKSHTVRTSAVLAVGLMGESGADFSHEVLKMLDDDMPNVRAAVVRTLSLIGETATGYTPIIAAQLNDPDEDIRAEVLEALGRLGEYGAAFALECAPLLYDPSPRVRAAAARGLAMMGVRGEAFVNDPSLKMVGDVSAAPPKGPAAEEPKPIAMPIPTPTSTMVQGGLDSLYGMLGKTK